VKPDEQKTTKQPVMIKSLRFFVLVLQDMKKWSYGHTPRQACRRIRVRQKQVKMAVQNRAPVPAHGP